MPSVIVPLHGDNFLEYMGRNRRRLDAVLTTLHQWLPYAPTSRKELYKMCEDGRGLVTANYMYSGPADSMDGVAEYDRSMEGKLKLASVLRAVRVDTGLVKYSDDAASNFEENQRCLREFIMGRGRTFNSLTETWGSDGDTVMMVDYTIPIKQQNKGKSIQLLQAHAHTVELYAPGLNKITYSPDSQGQIAERMHGRYGSLIGAIAKRAALIPDARKGYKLPDVCMIAYDHPKLFGDLEPLNVTELEKQSETPETLLDVLGLNPNQI